MAGIVVVGDTLPYCNYNLMVEGISLIWANEIFEHSQGASDAIRPPPTHIQLNFLFALPKTSNFVKRG